MALPITNNLDYIGHLRVSTSKSSQLDEYIAEYEQEYIKLLTNNRVYSDIKTLANPLPQKYLDLINGVDYTDSCGDFQVFQGIKPLLTRFVYYSYNADNFQTSIGGNVRSSNENSNVLTAENTSIVVKRYNEAVRLYRDEVCLFLEEHEELSQLMTASTQGAGIVTIGLSSTKYLSDGNVVTIFGIDYVISNLVTDTSFEVASIDPIIIDGSTDKVTYKPYYDFCPKHIPFTSWL